MKIFSKISVSSWFRIVINFKKICITLEVFSSYCDVTSGKKKIKENIYKSNEDDQCT